MEPNMGPYIALAWLISVAGLSAVTGFSLWRYHRRNR